MLYICADCVRTPIARGNDRGKLHNIHPVSLLSYVLDNVTARCGVNKAEVEDVICGCVTPIGDQGANIPRIALLKAGYPVSVPGVQINRMCGSSQQAIHFGAQAIAAGDMDMVIACGVEMMSRCKMGADSNTEIWTSGHKPESLSFAPFPHKLIHQGVSAELIAEHYNISRDDMERLTVESHRRCHEAIQAGRFKSQILPIKVNDSEWMVIDEGIRYPVDTDKLRSLKVRDTPIAFFPDPQFTRSVSVF